MRVYQEIDIQNPFTMSDILSDQAWNNLYLIQQNGYLDELESILESFDGWSLGDLDDYLSEQVVEELPWAFGEEDDEDDEDEE